MPVTVISAHQETGHSIGRQVSREKPRTPVSINNCDKSLHALKTASVFPYVVKKIPGVITGSKNVPHPATCITVRQPHLSVPMTITPPLERAAITEAFQRVVQFQSTTQSVKNVGREFLSCSSLTGVQKVTETAAFKQYQADIDFLIQTCLETILPPQTLTPADLTDAVSKVCGEDANAFLLHSLHEHAGRMILNSTLTQARKNLASCPPAQREEAKQALENAQHALKEYNGTSTGIDFQKIATGRQKNLKKRITEILERATNRVFYFRPATPLPVQMFAMLLPCIENVSTRVAAHTLGATKLYATTQAAVNEHELNHLVRDALLRARFMSPDNIHVWERDVNTPLLAHKDMSPEQQEYILKDIRDHQIIADYLKDPTVEKLDDATQSMKSLVTSARDLPAFDTIIPQVQTHSVTSFFSSLVNFLTPQPGLENSAWPFTGAQASPLNQPVCPPLTQQVLIAPDFSGMKEVPASASIDIKLKRLSETDDLGRDSLYEAWQCSGEDIRDLKILLAGQYHIYDSHESTGPSLVNWITQRKNWTWPQNQRPVGILMDNRPLKDPNNPQSGNIPADFPEDQAMLLILRDLNGNVLFEKAYAPESSNKVDVWHHNVCKQINRDMLSLPETSQIKVKSIGFESFNTKKPLLGNIVLSNYRNVFMAGNKSQVTDASWKFIPVTQLPDKHRLDIPTSSILHNLATLLADKTKTATEKRQQILNTVSKALPGDHLHGGDKVTLYDDSKNTSISMRLDRYLYDNRWHAYPASFFGHTTHHLTDILKHPELFRIYQNSALQSWGETETSLYTSVLTQCGLNAEQIRSVTPADSITLTFKGTPPHTTNHYILDMNEFLMKLTTPGGFTKFDGQFVSLETSVSGITQHLQKALMSQHAYLIAEQDKSRPLSEQKEKTTNTHPALHPGLTTSKHKRKKRNIIAVPPLPGNYPKTDPRSGKVPVRAFGAKIWWMTPEDAVKRRLSLVPGSRIDSTALQRYNALKEQQRKVKQDVHIVIHAGDKHKPAVITTTRPTTTITTPRPTNTTENTQKFEWDIEEFMHSDRVSIDFPTDKPGDYKWVHEAILKALDAYKEILRNTTHSAAQDADILTVIKEAGGLTLDISFGFGDRKADWFADKITINPTGTTLDSWFSDAATRLYNRIDHKFSGQSTNSITFIEAQLLYPAIKKSIPDTQVIVTEKVWDRITKELSETNGDADASLTIRGLALQKLRASQPGTINASIASAEKAVVADYYLAKTKKLEKMQKLLIKGIPSQREFLARQFALYLGLKEDQWPVIAMQSLRVKTKDFVSNAGAPGSDVLIAHGAYDGLSVSKSDKGRTLLDILYDPTFRIQASRKDSIAHWSRLPVDLAKALNISTQDKNTSALASKIQTLFSADFILYNDALPESLRHPEKSYKEFLENEMTKRASDIRELEIEKIILSSPNAVHELKNVKEKPDEQASYFCAQTAAEAETARIMTILRDRINTDQFQDLKSNWESYLQMARTYVGFIPVIGGELALLLDVVAGDDEAAAIDAMMCLLSFIPESGSLTQLARIVEITASTEMATSGLINAIRARDPQAISSAIMGMAMTSHSLYHSGVQLASHFSGDPVMLSNGNTSPSMLYEGKTVPAYEDRGQKIPAVEYNGEAIPAYDFHGKLIPAFDSQGQWVPAVEYQGKLTAGTEFNNKIIPAVEYEGKWVPAIRYEGELYPVFKNDGSTIQLAEFEGISTPAINVAGEIIPVIWYRDRFIRAQYHPVSKSMMPAVMHPGSRWGVAVEHNGELVPALEYGNKLTPSAFYEGELRPLIHHNNQWMYATIEGDELLPALMFEGETYQAGITRGTWVPAMAAKDGSMVPAVRLNNNWVPAERYQNGWAPQSVDRYGRTGIIVGKHGEDDVVLFKNDENYKVITPQGNDWAIAKIEGSELVVDPEATIQTEKVLCRMIRGIEPAGTRLTPNGHVPQVRFTPEANINASPFDPFKPLQLTNPAAYAQKKQLEVNFPPAEGMNSEHDFALWFSDRTSSIARQDHMGVPQTRNVQSDHSVGEYVLLHGRLTKISVTGPVIEFANKPTPVKYNTAFPVEITAQQGIFYQVKMSDVCPTFSGNIYGGMTIAQSKTNPGRWYAVTAVEYSMPNGNIGLKHYFSEFNKSPGITSASPLNEGAQLYMHENISIANDPDNILVKELIHLHDRSVIANQLACIYGKDQLSHTLKIIGEETALAHNEREFTLLNTNTTPAEQWMFDTFDWRELGEYDGNFYHNVVAPSVHPLGERSDYRDARRKFNAEGHLHNVDLKAIGAFIKKWPHSGNIWNASQSATFATFLHQSGIELDTPLKKYKAWLYIKAAESNNPHEPREKFAAAADIFARWGVGETSLSEAFDDVRMTVSLKVMENGRNPNFDFSSAEHPTGQSSAIAVARLTAPEFIGKTFIGVNAKLSDIAKIPWDDNRTFRHSGASQAQRHAEEMVVNEIHTYALSNNISPQDVHGQLIIMVDKSDGVCSSCKAGLITEGRIPAKTVNQAPIAAFSKNYPNLDIKFQVRKLENINSGNKDFSVIAGVRRPQC